MGVLYIAAGINHFLNADFYLRMMPRPFPYPMLAVELSGIAEVALGIGVLIHVTRKWCAYGIILLLIAIFPANINMALHPHLWDIPEWMLYARLPLQFVLMWWAWRVSKA
jgi:Predicted membrane protein